MYSSGGLRTLAPYQSMFVRDCTDEMWQGKVRLQIEHIYIHIYILDNLTPVM